MLQKTKIYFLHHHKMVIIIQLSLSFIDSFFNLILINKTLFQ